MGKCYNKEFNSVLFNVKCPCDRFIYHLIQIDDYSSFITCLILKIVLLRKYTLFWDCPIYAQKIKTGEFLLIFLCSAIIEFSFSKKSVMILQKLLFQSQKPSQPLDLFHHLSRLSCPYLLVVRDIGLT